ncbi:MAG: hypothetical protein AAF517_21450, partial [Planctomycetota bacterium]
VKTDGKSATMPKYLEVEAEFLDMQRKKSRFESATAKGQNKPVVVTAYFPDRKNLKTGGVDREDPFRFHAPEVKLDAKNRAIDLVGTADTASRMEFTGGDVRAGKIRFEEKKSKCTLEDDVDVRLFAKAKKGESPRIKQRIRAHRADLQFYPQFKAPSAVAGSGEFDRIESLQAQAQTGESIVVSGDGYELRGEEATWVAASQELRFFGRGMQEIRLDQEQIEGPIRAREIVYDGMAAQVTLRDSVSGSLRQPPKPQRIGTKPNPKSVPLYWEFETSVLEVDLARDEDDRSVLSRLRAHEKVLLLHRERGVKLVGDEMVYDHTRKSIRVFSNEQRLQTLVRERVTTKDTHEKDRRADTIRAREMRVVLYEDPAPRRAAPPRRRVFVEFDGEVIANFLVSGIRSARNEYWKVESKTLSVELDPSVSSSSPQAMPSAVAAGDVVASSSEFRADGQRAEYTESKRSLRVTGQPATVTRLAKKPRKGNEPRTANEIIIRKDGDFLQIIDPRQRKAAVRATAKR